MSSPLDGRMRAIARAEAGALLGVPDGAQESGVGSVQQQLTDLHEHLHRAATTIRRLEERVVVLEKAAEQTTPPARRTSRKTTDASPE